MASLIFFVLSQFWIPSLNSSQPNSTNCIPFTNVFCFYFFVCAESLKHLAAVPATSSAAKANKAMAMVRSVRLTLSMVRSSPVPPPPSTMAMATGPHLATNRTTVPHQAPTPPAVVAHCKRPKTDCLAKQTNWNHQDAVLWTE